MVSKSILVRIARPRRIQPGPLATGNDRVEGGKLAWVIEVSYVWGATLAANHHTDSGQHRPAGAAGSCPVRVLEEG